MESIKPFICEEIIKLPFTMLMLGKSGSGKTEQLHRIIHSLRKGIKSIYLFSKTGKINREEYPYIPDDNVFDFLDLVALRKITDNQLNLPCKKEKLPEVVIILDDIISDPNISSGQIRELYTMMRHLHVSTIFLSQSYVQTGGLGTIIRDNTHHIISFFQHNEKKRKSFVEEFLSIKDKKQGEEIYKNVTQTKYQSMFINCKNTSAREYHEYVFFYFIDFNKKVPKFYIGNDNSVILKSGSFLTQEDKIAHYLL